MLGMLSEYPRIGLAAFPQHLVAVNFTLQFSATPLMSLGWLGGSIPEIDVHHDGMLQILLFDRPFGLEVHEFQIAWRFVIYDHNKNANAGILVFFDYDTTQEIEFVFRQTVPLISLFLQVLPHDVRLEIQYKINQLNPEYTPNMFRLYDLLQWCNFTN